ncbi:MAG TPA: DNA repair protein RecO [Firmicutes bacterium]|nr:DNA repair protein RecO [Candidatus Fermentithermobacillaceae bacterium]
MFYQSEGVVLDQGDLGENDKIATIFTRQEGLVRAVVKGAQRPKSKLRGLTQPFTYAVFQIFRGRSLDRVTQVSIKTGFPNIMDNYEKMIYARYLVELLTCVLPEREENNAQFDLLLAVLDCLEQKEGPWVVARWAELGILSLAGFAPSFSACVSCGRETLESPVYFSLRNGGAFCGQCSRSGISPKESQVRAYGEFIRVSPGALRTLEMLLPGTAPASGQVTCPNITARGQVREEINEVSRKYVAFVLEKRLKSAGLVESIEDRK